MTQPWIESDSGLIRPADPPQPPAPPEPKRPPLEIDDEDDRKQAKKALWQLWYAMDLVRGREQRLMLSADWEAVYDARLAAWRHLGKMILGDECPDEMEEWT